MEANLRNMDLNYIALKDIEPALNYYTPVIITNDDLVKNNPDLINRFMKATAKGYRYAIANPEAAAKILLKHAPELKPELVIASQKFLSTRYQADSPVWGLQKQEVWTRFYDWMAEQQLIEQNYDIKSAFTNEFLPSE